MVDEGQEAMRGLVLNTKAPFKILVGSGVPKFKRMRCLCDVWRFTKQFAAICRLQLQFGLES